MNYLILKEALHSKSSHKISASTRRFFKTGVGDYSEKDIFIGVKVPDIRVIARTYQETPLIEVKQLLKSHIHEERFLALVLLVYKFKKQKSVDREKIFLFYMKHKKWINNWDLVDVSAPLILGEYCLENNSSSILLDLIKRDSLWERRLGVVGALAFIRKGKTDIIYSIAMKLMDDNEDLIHKAVGWMLREAGKKDEKVLRKFVELHGHKMPRVMLRYAIEKFSSKERSSILKNTNKSRS